ncbi:hypothetical protein ACQYWQ_02050 [Streptomyces sp. P6-2-1]|uniref:hypothetical protein n=1 Tax=Streptomyces sp. P6-2-1 TaxID=3422591 RepID=UPI003D36ACA5
MATPTYDGACVPRDDAGLVGPRAKENPEGVARHPPLRQAWRAGRRGGPREGAPRLRRGLRAGVAARPYEGVVRHHPDGRRAKLKVRDFGPWSVARARTVARTPWPHRVARTT